MEWGAIIVLSDYCIFIIIGRFRRLWKYDNSNSILITCTALGCTIIVHAFLAIFVCVCNVKGVCFNWECHF